MHHPALRLTPHIGGSLSCFNCIAHAQGKLFSSTGYQRTTYWTWILLTVVYIIQTACSGCHHRMICCAKRHSTLYAGSHQHPALSMPSPAPLFGQNLHLAHTTPYIGNSMRLPESCIEMTAASIYTMSSCISSCVLL